MTDTEKKIIEKLDQLIAANYHEKDFSTDSICLELGMSRSQLYRLLKEEFDISTSLYIRKRKLLKAKELVETSEMKIAEIAYAIGIDSPQNFTKYFTQEFGINPTEFRRNLVAVAENPSKQVQHLTEEKEQNQSEQYTEKETITETKTERIIEQKTTIEQKITEAITERKIQTERKIGKVIEIPVKTSRKKFRYAWYFLAACVLVFVVYFSWQVIKNEQVSFFKKGSSDQSLTNFAESAYTKPVGNFAENTIAILPFKNLGNVENAIFADGMMEQIHSSLSQLENLKVISKTSSNQFRDTQKTIPQIANELHVSYVLEGSVMRIDNQVRISVQLIHTKEDKVVWAKNYDGRAKEVFAYMNTVAKGVVTELNQKLSQIESKKLDKIPTKNLEAYNEYLQAKELMQTRIKEKLEASLLKYEKAITLDPQFADAYAHLALAYFLLGDSRYIEEEDAYKMTEKNALIAIRLDGENALAYANLANIYRDQNKWEQANTTYQIALKHSPSDALINYWYSLLLRSLGRVDEAIKYSTKAVELDPLNYVITGGHICNYISANELDLAEKTIKEVELLFNMSWTYYWARGYLNAVRGDYKTAIEEYSKSKKLNPNAKVITYHLMYCKAKLGQTQQVKDYLKTLTDIPNNYTGFIVIYAGLGDKESAMTYLQKYADAGSIPTDLKVIHCYKILWGDERYEAILQKFGLAGEGKMMQ